MSRVMRERPFMGGGAAAIRPPRAWEGSDGFGGVLAGDLLQSLGEAARVRLLGLGQRLQPFRELGEALVTRRLGHARVHLRVLVLPRDGRLEVRLRLADGLARGGIAHVFEEVEMPKGVARLGIRGVLEEPGHVREALDVRHPGEIEVAPVRLRLAGKGLLEVLVALRALDALACHGLLLLGGGALQTQGERRGRCRRALADRHGGQRPKNSMRWCVMASPVRAAIRTRRASAWGSARGPSTSTIRPHRTQVKWWWASMLASKRAWGPGISAASPSATRSRRLRYTVPRLTRGSRGRTRRWTDSAVGCASVPRSTSRTTRRGLVRRSPRARRAASELLGMVLITKWSLHAHPQTCQGHWVNLLRHTSLRAGRQPSTYTHVRLGLPARSRLVWLATCPSACAQTGATF